MNKNTFKNLALILLLGITAFSMVRYVSELKARFRLQDSLTQSRGEVTALTQEKQNLLQELGKEKELSGQLAIKQIKLKAYLGASKDRINRLFKDNSKTQDKLEEVNVKFSILKAENRALIDSHLRNYTEIEQLKLKLSSELELKKVIRELKAKKSTVSSYDEEGNRGFLFWNGRPTAEKIKIEVIPAKTKE